MTGTSQMQAILSPGDFCQYLETQLFVTTAYEEVLLLPSGWRPWIAAKHSAMRTMSLITKTYTVSNTSDVKSVKVCQTQTQIHTHGGHIKPTDNGDQTLLLWRGG